jgi:3-oxoadipate enol-lactonase
MATKLKTRPFRYKDYSSGFPVVIIPGLDGITDFFDDISPELAAGYRVILYFLPLAREAKNAGKDYTFEYLAADLKEVLEELGIEKAHVVGESFGGVVAQTFALEYPELLEKLILISTAPKFDLTRKDRYLLPVFPLVPMAVFARDHVREVCEPKDPQWSKELFIRNASWADHASVVARARIVSRVDLTERVKDIEVPTLLVVGADDAWTGETSRKMLDMLPDGRMVDIPGGHLCHMVSPKEFSRAAIDFLGQ